MPVWMTKTRVHSRTVGTRRGGGIAIRVTDRTRRTSHSRSRSTAASRSTASLYRLGSRKRLRKDAARRALPTEM